MWASTDSNVISDLLIRAAISQATIGLKFYPQTADELTAAQQKHETYISIINPILKWY